MQFLVLRDFDNRKYNLFLIFGMYLNINLLKTISIAELKEFPSLSNWVAAFSLMLEEGGFEFGMSPDWWRMDNNNENLFLFI